MVALVGMRLLGRYRWILSDCWRQKHFLPIPPGVYLLSIFRVYWNAQIPEERNEEMKRSEIMFDISYLTHNLFDHYCFFLAYSRTSFSISCSQFVEKFETSDTIVTYQRDLGPNVWLDGILQVIQMILCMTLCLRQVSHCIFIKLKFWKEKFVD